MARKLYGGIESFRKDMDQCFDWVKAFSGLELKPVLFPDGVDEDEARHQLSQTIVAQPALFSIEFALSRLLKSLNIEPNAMFGHSVSEYVAACLSGVYSPESAMRVICKRGQLVQSVPEGAMLAVRLSETEISPYIAGHLDLGSTLASDHCVVSGEPKAIADLEARLKNEGIEPKQVKVSRAYHSKMIDPILDEYRSFVAAVELQSPRIPFISCVTGDWITEEQARSPEYWVKQLRSPVRLHEAFKALSQQEAVFMEVGCGTMLSSLAKALPELNERHSFVSTLPSFCQQIDDLAFMHQELGRLTSIGIEVNEEQFEAWFPSLENNDSNNAQVNDPALSEMEKTISGYFRDVLGQTQVDKNDNFLEAGGNSLMAMQLISRIREDLEIDLSLRDFFEHLTIASLSTFLETPGSNPQNQPEEVVENSDDLGLEKKDTTSKAMKLSVFFFSGNAEAQPDDRYKMVIHAAEFADENGFDAIWIPERHFNKFGGLYPNLAVLGATIAARTQHIHMRGGSAVAPLHHPVRIAEEWATLDNISRGRVAFRLAPDSIPKTSYLPRKILRTESK
jgi:malonyl CoA-acyl carrier protein transacylase/acyl carrier protein